MDFDIAKMIDDTNQLKLKLLDLERTYTDRRKRLIDLLNDEEKLWTETETELTADIDRYERLIKTFLETNVGDTDSE